jgi:hypothetical protein
VTSLAEAAQRATAGSSRSLKNDFQPLQSPAHRAYIELHWASDSCSKHRINHSAASYGFRFFFATVRTRHLIGGVFKLLPAAWSLINRAAAPAHNPLTETYFLEAELRQEIGSKE